LRTTKEANDVANGDETRSRKHTDAGIDRKEEALLLVRHPRHEGKPDVAACSKRDTQRQ
jgi:hypothetical protein